MAAQNHTFYVTILKKDEHYTGHIISQKIPEDIDATCESLKEEKGKNISDAESSPFKSVFKSFISMIDYYRKFIPITLNFLPFISSFVGEKGVEAFVKKVGTEISKDPEHQATIYELPVSCYRKVIDVASNTKTAIDASSYIPEIMILGLISAYDAFLSNLLRVLFDTCPDLIMTADKSIKFSDLNKFPSIEAARSFIVDKEIESILRDSHHEQFEKMEKIFGLQLKNDLEVWPFFVELCERRNLLTHTGGIVSQQYIMTCKSNKVETADITIGEKLKIDPKYYSTAVETILEIGTKLCYVFWRKFLKTETDLADIELNDFCYNLIREHSYKCAESLLCFGIRTITERKGNDSTRRMMIINYANTVRLQGKNKESIEILSKEDWSATNDTFLLCIEAIRGNTDNVISVMKRIGTTGRPNADEYREWPVFNGFNTNETFLSTFENIFHEPFIPQSLTDAQPQK